MRQLGQIVVVVLLTASGLHSPLAEELTAVEPTPGSLAPVPGEDRPSDRAAIRAHIDSIFRAYIAKDREAVRATHAQEWRGFLTNTPAIVRGIKPYMAEAEISLSRPQGMVGYEMIDFDVLFYGDTAMVPYIARLDVVIGGTHVAPLLRVLDVYARLDGDWIQVASNTSLHPETQAEYRRYPRPLTASQRERLLAAREAVWRAWFTNDRPHLEATIPPETVAINAGEEAWVDREAVLRGARELVASGAKLVRLEFPRTEFQVYGDVAILYSRYELELESDGVRQVQAGRGTEVFVLREGRWLNAGWHLDSGS